MILSVSLSVDVNFFFQTKLFLLSVEFFLFVFFCFVLFFFDLSSCFLLSICVTLSAVFSFFVVQISFCKIYKTAAEKVGIVPRVCCMMSLPYS